MTLCAWLLLVLAAAAAAAAAADEEPAAAAAATGAVLSRQVEGDSLQSALEAVNRRQRDLAALDGVVPLGVGGPGPGPVPLPLPLADPFAASLPLAASRDLAGDGQPENIGYGYQKSSSAAGGGGGGASPVERLLLEYLEATPLEALEKRKRASAFRERGRELLEMPYTPFQGAPRKRDALPLSLPHTASFWQRARARPVSLQPLDELEELEARKREEMMRESEEGERQEPEEEEEAEEGVEGEGEGGGGGEGGGEGEGEEEYARLLQALWRKWQTRRLSPLELQELLSSGDVDKRQYGGFDYFNNAGALGGMQSGGMYRKRWSAPRDSRVVPGVEVGAEAGVDPEEAGARLLLALRMASPAEQREALQALQALQVDADADAVWKQVAAAAVEAAEMTPDYQTLLAEREGAGDGAGVGQRVLREFPLDGALLAQRRRRGFWRAAPAAPTAPVAKRYPVAKRSSDFYANPPLMHRRGAAFTALSAFAAPAPAPGPGSAPGLAGMEHDAHPTDANAATDPKVARELNQIFGGGGGGGGEGAHGTTVGPETPGAPEGSPAPPAAGPTTPAAGPQGPVTGGQSEEAAPQVATDLQWQGPRLQVRKKSVDWSQYFGLDRRRKKVGEEASARQLQGRERALALAAVEAAEAEAEHRRRQRQRQRRRGFDTKSSQSAWGGEDGDADGDARLRGAEDALVEEALKLTGAQQGAEDPLEVQRAKARILERLAAAYNLEKMRMALREFKSSLQQQKMSRYNPENQATSEDKEKRMMMKRKGNKEKEIEKDGKAQVVDAAREFLGPPWGIEPLSEGFSGSSHLNRARGWGGVGTGAGAV